jgi:hypothetical protein
VDQSILRRVAVHDHYQLEMKLGYPLVGGRKTRYRIDTYIFAPQSLGINAVTYGRSDFYRDIQHYVRMKTPQLTLRQLLDEPNSPLCDSEKVMATHPASLSSELEQRLRDSFRFLRAILKSALQEAASPMNRPAPPNPAARAAIYLGVANALLDDAGAIIDRYRFLGIALTRAHAGPTLQRTYRLTDESMSLLVEEALLKQHEQASLWLPTELRDLWRERLAAKIRSEIAHRQEQRYPSVLTKQSQDDYLLRVSALKKFTSSVLWLPTNVRREGTTWEQVLFSIAAGVSMVFATVVAFFAQSIYGQFTLPVFVALVVAYMFKDRIKEQGRAMSASFLSRRLYDYRTVIQTQDEQRTLGYVREKMTYVDLRQVPEAVRAVRDAGADGVLDLPSQQETVILYTKDVMLNGAAFRYIREHDLGGNAINDIMRYDIRPFLRKMDDPRQEKLMLEGERVVRVRCHRTYHLNLVSVFRNADQDAPTSERTLLVLDRKGIVRIAQFDEEGRILDSTVQADNLVEPTEAEYAP